MLSSKQSFPKHERLTGKKSVKALFSKGKSVFIYPFKVLYLPHPAETSELDMPQILITVPKKNFKKAVDRNLLKRQIREAYRTQKAEIFALSGQSCPKAMAFIFVAKEKLSYPRLKKKLKEAMLKVQEKL